MYVRMYECMYMSICLFVQNVCMYVTVLYTDVQYVRTVFTYTRTYMCISLRKIDVKVTIAVVGVKCRNDEIRLPVRMMNYR